MHFNTCTAATALAMVVATVTAHAQTDRDALMALYHATNGPGWEDRANWGSDRPLREWDGVSTNDAGRVIAVRLNNNNLSGSVPPEIGSLSRLELLSLSGNAFCSLPPELGQLANLKALRMSDALEGGPACNEGVGSIIPPELGNLTRLEVLDLSVNSLVGSVPPELGELVSLRELSLNDNRLTGSVPSELGRLVNLRALHLNENRLTGAVPSELGQLTNLATLNLAGNRLALPIPPSLVELPNLVWFGLGYVTSVDMGAVCVDDLGQVAGSRQLSGSWDGSCTSVHYDAGEYARYYNFTLERAASVTLDLVSPSVDTWLALRSGAGMGTGLLEENDDGGDDVGSARITGRLGAGTYTVEATTYGGGVTGPFTLTVTVSDP